MQLTTVGLDLAKHVFQVHGVDTAGNIVLKRRLRRGQMIAFFAGLAPCLVGMEACATAHFWARELAALGHDVRLMPAQYVKAYVKRGKNDAADAAAAICEAVPRPSMRFVPVKSEAQQAALMLHRARDLLVRQRTQLINAVRGHLAEFGIVEAQGAWNLPRVLAHLETEGELPEVARQILRAAPRRSVGRGGAEDRRPRCPDRRLAQGQPGQPAARDHPRHRAAGRHGDHGHHCRSQHLPQRPGVRRLARARAEAAIDRRKAAAGPDQP